MLSSRPPEGSHRPRVARPRRQVCSWASLTTVFASGVAPTLIGNAASRALTTVGGRSRIGSRGGRRCRPADAACWVLVTRRRRVVRREPSACGHPDGLRAGNQRLSSLTPSGCSARPALLGSALAAADVGRQASRCLLRAEFRPCAVNEGERGRHDLGCADAQRVDVPAAACRDELSGSLSAAPRGLASRRRRAGTWPGRPPRENAADSRTTERCPGIRASAPLGELPARGGQLVMRLSLRTLLSKARAGTMRRSTLTRAAIEPAG